MDVHARKSIFKEVIIKAKTMWNVKYLNHDNASEHMPLKWYNFTSVWVTSTTWRKQLNTQIRKKDLFEIMTRSELAATVVFLKFTLIKLPQVWQETLLKNCTRFIIINKYIQILLVTTTSHIFNCCHSTESLFNIHSQRSSLCLNKLIHF